MCSPALVRYATLTVRRGHPTHEMPHSGGALPPLLTKATIPSPLLACGGGGLASAGQNVIIRGGRLGSKCGWIESFDDKPHPYEHLPQAARNCVDRLQIEPQDF